MKLAGNIDKLGILGLVVIILFSPCCFSLFMFAAAALCLGSFELFGGWTMWLPVDTIKRRLLRVLQLWIGKMSVCSGMPEIETKKRIQ